MSAPVMTGAAVAIGAATLSAVAGVSATVAATLGDLVPRALGVLPEVATALLPTGLVTGAALALKATVVLAGGLLAAWILGRGSAAARHLAWAFTFAALLLLPLASATLPGVAVELPLVVQLGDAAANDAAAVLWSEGESLRSSAPAAPNAGAAALTASPAARGADRVFQSASDPDLAPAPTAVLDPIAPPAPTALPSPAETPSAVDRLAAAVGGLRPSVGTSAVLAALYLAGAGALLLWLAVGLATVTRYTRHGRAPAADAGLEAEVVRLSRRLGVRRAVRVVVSAGIAVPMVWGFRRPVILLPPAAETWSAAHRRDALLHELAHVRRGDWPLQLFARVVVALYWFHPLAWAALGRLRLEAERACDDRVLEAGSTSCDYAERLVDLARGAARLRPQAAVAMSGRSQLALRIRSLLDVGRRRAPLHRSAAVALALLFLVPALALGAMRLAPEGALAGDSLDEALERSADSQEAAMEADERWVEWIAETEEARVEGGAPGSGRAEAGVARDSRTTARGSVAGRGGLAAVTPLMRASARGDAAAVRELLAAGADPDQGVPSLGTPLIHAALAGDAETVDALLAAGADPNLPETGSQRPGDLPRSALGAAARSGKVAVVDRLLAAGAAVDGRPRGDGTPLMIAARHGHLEVARRLVDRGADVNAVVRYDGTPLIEAARSGSRQVVAMLLAAGADARVAVIADGDPLIAAVQQGDPSMVELLLEAGADPEQWVPGDESGWYHAVADGDPEIVRLLLAAGADPEAVWPGEGTPLIVATRNGHREVLDLLVAAGADPDRAVRGDGTALLRAAAADDLAQVERLLAAGADPDAGAPEDGTPLIAAAASGNREVVRRLLAAGADPGLAAEGDGSPLIAAAAAGRLELVRELLAAGADPNAGVNGDGNPLIAAAAGGHLEVVRELLAAGAEIDRVVPGDENALIQAAGRGHLEVARALVAAGADVNARVEPTRWDRSRRVRTPLGEAERSGHDEVARYLRSQGARE